MKNKYYVISFALGIAVMFFLMKSCEKTNNEKFKSKISKLDKEIDSLKINNNIYLNKIQNLNVTIQKDIEKIDSIRNVLSVIKNKRNEVKDSVADYNDKQLDSILSNYRHPNGN